LERPIPVPFKARQKQIKEKQKRNKKTATTLQMHWRYILIIVAVIIVISMIVLIPVLLTIYPPVEDRVMMTHPVHGTEGLFSRVMHWVGSALYAERHKASGIILCSLDRYGQYSSEASADLCQTLLAKHEHELKPGGLQKKKWVIARTFGAEIWKGRSLKGQGAPGKSALGWPRMKEAFLKYVTFKSEFENAAKEFWEAKITAPWVLGIHWRGTDTNKRWPFVSHSPERFITAAKNALINHENACVFIASDEQKFVDLCHQELVGCKIVTQDMKRSTGQPLHLAADRDPESNARSVILDAILLSRCSHLIRGQSHVADYALFREPEKSCDFLLTSEKHYFKPVGMDSEFELKN